MNSGKRFLSEEWINEAVRLIEEAKIFDETVRSLSSELSLSVAYIIRDLPDRLKKDYGNILTIYVELDRGTTKKFAIHKGSSENILADYIVESTYDIAKKIFSGEMNPGLAFFSKLVKIKSASKIHLNLVFITKSLILFSALLRYIRKIPTTWD